jgi:hypothetical protein
MPAPCVGSLSIITLPVGKECWSKGEEATVSLIWNRIRVSMSRETYARFRFVQDERSPLLGCMSSLVDTNTDVLHQTLWLKSVSPHAHLRFVVAIKKGIIRARVFDHCCLNLANNVRPRFWSQAGRLRSCRAWCRPEFSITCSLCRLLTTSRYFSAIRRLIFNHNFACIRDPGQLFSAFSGTILPVENSNSAQKTTWLKIKVTVRRKPPG